MEAPSGYESCGARASADSGAGGGGGGGGGGWGGWGGKGVYFSVLNLLLLLLRVAGGEWVAGSPRTPPSARGAEGPGLERGLQPSSCWGETLGSLGMLQRPDLLCVPRWGPALVGWNLQAGSELRTGLCSPTVPFPLLPFAPLQHLLGLALRSSRGNPSSPTQGSVTVCSLWAPRPALINQLPANEALGTQQAQAICCLPPVWGSPIGVLEGLGCLFPPVRAGPWFAVLRGTNKGLGGMADLGGNGEGVSCQPGDSIGDSSEPLYHWRLWGGLLVVSRGQGVLQGCVGVLVYVLEIPNRSFSWLQTLLGKHALEVRVWG